MTRDTETEIKARQPESRDMSMRARYTECELINCTGPASEVGRVWMMSMEPMRTLKKIMKLEERVWKGSCVRPGLTSGSVMSSRVVFPDMNHFCLVRHCGGVFADGVDAWVNELKELMKSLVYPESRGTRAGRWMEGW